MPERYRWLRVGDGWQYRGTSGVELKGQLMMVQHYQRPTTEPAEEVVS